MPKQKITKDMVINAAFELARNDGMEQVIVKNIAEKLGCSVQPIYSYCSNMRSLRLDVMKKAGCFIQQYLKEHTDPDNMFQSTGHAFVRLSKEEPNIFKMFILRPRDDISSLDDLYQSETSEETAKSIAAKLNISLPQAKSFHLNMLIYTIGIGTIFSVTTPGISPDEIFARQETAYQAFLKQALEDKE